MRRINHQGRGYTGGEKETKRGGRAEEYEDLRICFLGHRLGLPSTRSQGNPGNSRARRPGTVRGSGSECDVTSFHMWERSGRGKKRKKRKTNEKHRLLSTPTINRTAHGQLAEGHRGESQIAYDLLIFPGIYKVADLVVAWASFVSRGENILILSSVFRFLFPLSILSLPW